MIDETENENYLLQLDRNQVQLCIDVNRLKRSHDQTAKDNELLRAKLDNLQSSIKEYVREHEKEHRELSPYINDKWQWVIIAIIAVGLAARWLH